MSILTLNAGSSSLKFALYPEDDKGKPILSGKISGIGRAPVFAARDTDGHPLDGGALDSLDAAAEHEQLIALLLPWLEGHVARGLSSVGHRVVHGGQNFSAPTRITDAVMQALEALVPLAPLHQPHSLAAIRAVAAWRPGLPQIACFDTGFHSTQDRLAQLFALPRALSDEGILRYGFHGLSYDYIAGILPEHLGDLGSSRVIVAHLGNGSSMCAMKDRRSVATSMGFTALDGLMMGQRCGTLDPGVVLYLMQAKGLSAQEVSDLLYERSGLLGVSGISNSMAVLQDSDDPRAREAIDLYCWRAASVLAGLVPAIGGLDAVVFTAGIGENAAQVRAAICARLGWLGVTLDEAANAAHGPCISAGASAVRVLVLPTNEEAVVAAACRRVQGQTAN